MTAEVSFTSTEYDALGVKVGMTLDEAENILTEAGCTKDSDGCMYSVMLPQFGSPLKTAPLQGLQQHCALQPTLRILLFRAMKQLLRLCSMKTQGRQTTEFSKRRLIKLNQ